MNYFHVITKGLLGHKTSRKIVVFFADDYGSVRTWNKQAYNKLCAKGIPMEESYFSANDSLCSNEDFEALYDVLTSIKDSRDHYAVITPCANIANPDFESIISSNYDQYHRETFKETLEKYGNSHNNVFKLWKEGIENDCFHPVYHGTEHVSINLLMDALQRNHFSIKTAFMERSLDVPTIKGEKGIPTGRTFYVDSHYDNSIIDKSIAEGLSLFESLLGYGPLVFTPSQSTQSLHHNKVLSENGIKYLCLGIKTSYPSEDGSITNKYYYNGIRIKNSQRILVKNCCFEPHGVDNYESANECLKQIEIAFKFHNPALISSHRANFAGFINEKNRKNSLKQLKYLYDNILKKWPDAIFVNADEYVRMCFK